MMAVFGGSILYYGVVGIIGNVVDYSNLIQLYNSLLLDPDLVKSLETLSIMSEHNRNIISQIFKGSNILTKEKLELLVKYHLYSDKLDFNGFLLYQEYSDQDIEKVRFLWKASKAWRST